MYKFILRAHESPGRLCHALLVSSTPRIKLVPGLFIFVNGIIFQALHAKLIYAGGFGIPDITLLVPSILR